MKSHSRTRKLQEKCSPLCKQNRPNNHFKKRAIKWQRGLILSLFSSTEHWLCTLIRTSSECAEHWHRPDRPITTSFSTVTKLSGHKNVCLLTTSSTCVLPPLFVIPILVFNSIAHLFVFSSSSFNIIILKKKKTSLVQHVYL